jgi:DNA polymerase III epsilon subunit-like protein
MKFISIDIETSGLDPESNQVLSIGAIIEDSENPLPLDKCPKFHAAIRHDEITGSLFAINLNRELIETIVSYQTCNNDDERRDVEKSSGMKFYHKDDIVEAFYHFLYLNGMVNVDPNMNLLERVMKLNSDGKSVPVLTSRIKPTHITVAGKNFATFDKLFLERLPRWKQAIRIKQRILDPAILYVDWKGDSSLPSLGECKERAGINGVVTHNALDDAWDVIELLRKKY